MLQTVHRPQYFFVRSFIIINKDYKMGCTEYKFVTSPFILINNFNSYSKKYTIVLSCLNESPSLLVRGHQLALGMPPSPTPKIVQNPCSSRRVSIVRIWLCEQYRCFLSMRFAMTHQCFRFCSGALAIIIRRRYFLLLMLMLAKHSC